VNLKNLAWEKSIFLMIPAVIKNDLPQTPDDVIDIWLTTHFERFGWPPRISNEWRYILGLGNDLEF
jgi:hypothetical protein